MDGTRNTTVEVARRLHDAAIETLGPVPFVALVNKQDRQIDWEVTAEDLTNLSGRGWPVITTSAKTGQGVEEAFSMLAKALLPAPSTEVPATEDTHGPA